MLKSVTCNKCEEKDLKDYRTTFYRAFYCPKCVGFFESRYALTIKVKPPLTEEEQRFKEIYDKAWYMGNYNHESYSLNN